jgi:hypothetical protein
MQQKIHKSHNVKRFHEMSGIKEKSLAPEMGDNWNQEKIFLEKEKQNETIGPSLLQHIPIVPKILTETFKNSVEEEAVIIANLFNGSVFDNAFNYETIHFFHKQET